MTKRILTDKVTSNKSDKNITVIVEKDHASDVQKICNKI